MKKVIKKNPILLLIPVLCIIILVVLCCGFFQTAAESNDDNPEVLMNAEQDPSADAASEPSAEPSSEPVTQPTESTEEIPTEPVIQSTEPTTEATAEPVTQSTEPMTEAPTEPETQPSEPMTEAPTEPATEPSEPATEIPTEPSTPPVTQPTKTFDPKSISFVARSTPLAGAPVPLAQTSIELARFPAQSTAINLTVYNENGENLLTECKVLTSLSYECRFQFISTTQELRDFLSYDRYSGYSVEERSRSEKMISKYNEEFFQNNVLMLVSYIGKYKDPFNQTRLKNVVRNGKELSYSFETSVHDGNDMHPMEPETYCNLIDVSYNELQSLDTISFYIEGRKSGF